MEGALAEAGRSVRVVLAALTGLLPPPWALLVLCLYSPPPRTWVRMPGSVCSWCPTRALHREHAEIETLSVGRI